MATQKVLCLTICAYKKPGMSQADYRAYMTEKHAPLVQDIMARYGMLSYTQIHCSDESRGMMDRIIDPQFANLADYDCIVTATFPDVENFARMKQDPYYKKYCMPDHENFADTRASKMTIGWVEEFVRDGRVLNPKPEVVEEKEETKPGLWEKKEESAPILDNHASNSDNQLEPVEKKEESIPIVEGHASNSDSTPELLEKKEQSTPIMDDHTNNVDSTSELPEKKEESTPVVENYTSNVDSTPEPFEKKEESTPIEENYATQLDGAIGVPMSEGMMGDGKIEIAA